MLEAIKTLGEYETETTKESLEDQLIDKAGLKNTKKVICIVFKKDEEEGSITYDHTHIEDYKSSRPRNYLYRSHQSRQFDIAPTTKIAYDSKNKKPEIEKAFKRIQYWFEKFIPIIENKNQVKNESYSKQVEFLKQVGESSSKNRDKILEDITKKSEELKANKNPREDEKRNSILTIKILEDEKEKYVGDFEIFKNILKEEGLRFVYSRHGAEIKGEGICILCGTKKEVSDYTLLKIYSVDKRGFAPEFIQKDAWKRFPICHDCLPYLITGENFLNNYLKKRKFYHGYQFYVIPNFILGNIDGNLIEEIKRQDRKEDYEGLLIDDDFFLDPIKESGGALNLIFMFCEFGQSVKVVKYVEDVPPSWINKLDTTLKEIKNFSIFGEESLKKMGVRGKKESGDLKHILPKRDTTVGGLVEAFFPKSQKTGVYSKYFIDIIGDILAQRPINKDLLMNAFMREIRNKHVSKDKWRERDEKILALKSLMLLLFLNKMNLIKG